MEATWSHYTTLLNFHVSHMKNEADLQDIF